MSKHMALFFASLSTLLLAATAVSIAHSLFWTLIFLFTWLIITGIGFIFKVKQKQK